MVSGLALPELFASAPTDQRADQQYIADMVAQFGLSSAQERSLRLVLQNEREAEITILSSAEWWQLPPPLLRRLQAERKKTKERIRVMLDDRQQRLFDQESLLPQREPPTEPK